MEYNEQSLREMLENPDVDIISYMYLFDERLVSRVFETLVDSPCDEEVKGEEHVLNWDPDMTAKYFKLKISTDGTVSGVLCPTVNDQQVPLIRLSDFTIWLYCKI